MVKRIIMFLWQLPQNIIGLFMAKIFCRKAGGFYCWKNQKGMGSVSLGSYIIIGETADVSLTLRHERGHQMQSKILGWLYLPVIGLPSILWCSFFSTSKKLQEKYSYYDFYTERWADKIAKIERS